RQQRRPQADPGRREHGAECAKTHAMDAHDPAYGRQCPSQVLYTSGLVSATGQATSSAPAAAATQAGARSARITAAHPASTTNSTASSGTTSTMNRGPTPTSAKPVSATTAIASTMACTIPRRRPRVSAPRNSVKQASATNGSSHQRGPTGSTVVSPALAGTAIVAAP